VCGSGFLKHMVRNIVGTLLEAGKGNLDADGVREFLTPGREKRAGPTAPAKGLFLVKVEYAGREMGTVERHVAEARARRG
jgi:tRNA pseudouridine38-40 synthase